MTAAHAPMPATRTETSAETQTVEVEFAAPMPGLSPHTAFRLEPLEGADGLYALRAVGADLRLFLFDPRPAGFGYDPVLSAGDRAEIGAVEADDVRVFVVANPADDGVYLNLRAPVIVHPQSGRAAQVILDDQDYPIRALIGD
nr:flagellar assembly protein FliW [Microbacterium hydrocarbonoxydans]